MKIVVTGATGYIGTVFTELATSKGAYVVVASRRTPLTHPERWMHFDLASNSAIELPPDVGAVLHLAANTGHANGAEVDSEAHAATLLRKAAEHIGARFVFVSSQTARPDAPTAYGRTKWRIEQEVVDSGGWVVRPGQVYGGPLRGLFGMLVGTVARLPLVPAFWPRPEIQPIHVNDLAEGLLRIVCRSDLPPGVFCLAASEPVSFTVFLRAVAQSRLHRRRIFLTVPVALVKLFAFALGKSLRARLGLDRLNSLFDLPPMATASDLQRTGLTLRPLSSGMHRSGSDRRRRLLQEGSALLAYVLKEPPRHAVLRRYAGAIESLRTGHSLDLPTVFLKYPALLSLLRDSSWIDSAAAKEFSWRLDAATLLAEADPRGASRFLGLGRPAGFLRSILSVTRAVAGEIFWRLLALTFLPIIRFSLTRRSRL